MSREIKFRAWDAHHGEMIHDYCWMDAESKNFKAYDLTNNPSYPSEVMQYTGLKDKNGREIYEGDVAITDLGHTVEIRWDFCTESTEEWDFEYTGFCMRNHKLQKNFHLDKGHVLTIIGNIYENPELLKP